MRKDQGELFIFRPAGPILRRFSGRGVYGPDAAVFLSFVVYDYSPECDLQAPWYPGPEGVENSIYQILSSFISHGVLRDAEKVKGRSWPAAPVKQGQKIISHRALRGSEYFFDSLRGKNRKTVSLVTH